MLKILCATLIYIYIYIYIYRERERERERERSLAEAKTMVDLYPFPESGAGMIDVEWMVLQGRVYKSPVTCSNRRTEAFSFPFFPLTVHFFPQWVSLY